MRETICFIICIRSNSSSPNLVMKLVFHFPRLVKIQITSAHQFLQYLAYSRHESNMLEVFVDAMRFGIKCVSVAWGAPLLFGKKNVENFS